VPRTLCTPRASPQASLVTRDKSLRHRGVHGAVRIPEQKCVGADRGLGSTAQRSKRQRDRRGNQKAAALRCGFDCPSWARTRTLLIQSRVPLVELHAAQRLRRRRCWDQV